MKLLAAYDGSECSESALDDLVNAGLPDVGEAVVITIAEVWLPPSLDDKDATGIHLDAYSERLIKQRYAENTQRIEEAKDLAAVGAKRFRAALPKWAVRSVGTYGSPSWEILSQARELRPDLILVGSHGHRSFSRFFLGSISQKVLTEAECSVRIARGRIEIDEGPLRLTIGFDGSQGSFAAINSVAGRKWPESTQIRLISAIHNVAPSIIGGLIPSVREAAEEINKTEKDWIEKLAEPKLKVLHDSGLSASLHIFSGNPKDVLVKKSEDWRADCIFLGANAAGGRIERFLLGTTSAAVAARAHCSVEAVRLSNY